MQEPIDDKAVAALLMEFYGINDGSTLMRRPRD